MMKIVLSSSFVQFSLEFSSFIASKVYLYFWFLVCAFSLCLIPLVLCLFIRFPGYVSVYSLCHVCFRSVPLCLRRSLSLSHL